jgi:L-threonylcarbamoyladenylate synthase
MMPIRLDARDAAARADAIAQGAAALREGALVAFPTETVYGLGALARDEAALERLFAAKRRPRDHPVIVHLAHAQQVEAWAESVPVGARLLAAACWPGPLTLVLRARADVPGLVTGGQPTVALRVPGHLVARELVAAVGDGVAAPSANRFGRVSPTTAAHVLAEFGGETSLDPVAIVLDGGPCEVGVESTILDLSTPQPRLLRPGGVTRELLESVLGDRVAVADGRGPRAPGSLARHYAPMLPASAVPAEAVHHVPDGVAVIHPRGVATDAARSWPLPDDPGGYARGLYAALREAERSGARAIWIAAVPLDGAWAAIADRVRRATSGPAVEETP